jgi:AcrR family transcriptional regulator
MTKGDGALSSRDVILAAARTLIASRGYDGMLISELSSMSGLPASSIYYHFGSKLGVLGALLERTFEELHASFPSPSSFDGHEPIERFELWFTAACAALDQRPDYLRLLLAVSVGSHSETGPVRETVRRIRDYGLASWVNALTPIFAPAGGDQDKDFIHHLAVMGRAMTDGLSVGTSYEGVTHSAHVAPFVALIRSTAAQRQAQTR